MIGSSISREIEIDFLDKISIFFNILANFSQKLGFCQFLPLSGKNPLGFCRGFYRFLPVFTATVLPQRFLPRFLEKRIENENQKETENETKTKRKQNENEMNTTWKWNENEKEAKTAPN